MSKESDRRSHVTTHRGAARGGPVLRFRRARRRAEPPRGLPTGPRLRIIDEQPELGVRGDLRHVGPLVERRALGYPRPLGGAGPHPREPGRRRVFEHQCQVAPRPSWKLLALLPSQLPHPNVPKGLTEKLLPTRTSHPRPAIRPRPVSVAESDMPPAEAPTVSVEMPTPPLRKNPDAAPG